MHGAVTLLGARRRHVAVRSGDGRLALPPCAMVPQPPRRTCAGCSDCPDCSPALKVRMTSDERKSEVFEREERWREFMRLAQDGDRVAYGRLLSEVLPVVRAMVRRRWRNPNDVEDIAQDVLLSIHAVRHTYDPGRPFGPWLSTITARRIADAARRAAARAANEITVDTMPETSSSFETKSEQDVQADHGEVERALAALSPSQRQAIQLMKLQGHSLEEAAAMTGKSVSSLKVTVHRAMKIMRRILE